MSVTQEEKRALSGLGRFGSPSRRSQKRVFVGRFPYLTLWAFLGDRWIDGAIGRFCWVVRKAEGLIRKSEDGMERRWKK